MSDKTKKPAPERVQVVKVRRCLMCEDKFESTWAGERICKRCKSSNAWRAGADFEAA